MKRRFLIVVIALAVALCSFGLFACGDGDDKAANEYYISFDAGYYGVVDGSSSVRTSDGKVAEFPTVIAYNGWKFMGWQLEDGAAVNEEYVFTSDTTVVAKYEVDPDAPYTAGLLYEPVKDANEEITGYIVSGLNAYDQVKYINIPSEHEGKPVVGIKEWAFDNFSAVKRVSIPDSVKKIGKNAFNGFDQDTDGVVYADKWAIRYDGDSAKIELRQDTVGIADSVFVEKNNLTEVTIPNSVTSIGDSAFERCSSLTSVTIPNSVTSIGERTFSGCSSLSEVAIPNGVTSIGNYAFQGCISLTSIEIPNSVTSIGDSAFYGCPIVNATMPTIAISAIARRADSKLKVVIINGGNSIEEYAFNLCYDLTEITIPSSVTSIGKGAFSQCSKLEIVNFDGDVKSWCQINGIASIKRPSCTLKINGAEVEGKLVIPDGVTSISGSAFSGCSKITSVEIPNSVTSIGEYAFFDCDGITSVNIGNGVTSIGGGAFYGCSGLTSIAIPNGVTSISESAFSGCSSLTSIEIPNSVTSIGGGAFSDCSSLTSIAMPDSVTSIGSGAFSDCSSLTSIAIPNGVTSILERTFICCSSLTSITIPSSVTNIKEFAFNSCNSLAEIRYKGDIKSWCEISGLYELMSYGSKLYINNAEITDLVIPNNVTSIGSAAFRRCSSLTSVTIPNSVTSISSDAFAECKIATATIPVSAIAKIDKNYLKTVVIVDGEDGIGDRAFSGFGELTSVTIPTSVTSIGEYAFYNCGKLTDIVLHDNIDYIGQHAFENCTGLVGIEIPAAINNNLADYVFSGCSNLTSVTLNNVRRIGDGAFENCVKLAEVTITNCSMIGERAFANCTALASFTIKQGSPQIRDRAFYGCRNLRAFNAENSMASLGVSAFENCGVTGIILGAVTSVGNNAFKGCDDMVTAVFLSNIGTVGNNVFSGCNKLVIYCAFPTKPNGWSASWNSGNRPVIWDYVDLATGQPKNDKDENGYIYWATEDTDIRFKLKDGVATIIAQPSILDGDIVIPANVTYKNIQYPVTAIEEGAFSRCRITSIEIPSSVTSIGNYAFQYCNSLTSIRFADIVCWCGISGLYTIDLDKVYIDDEKLTEMTSITIPDGVTSIPAYAFRGCRRLMSITIPDSVTSIGSAAFDGCPIETATIPAYACSHIKNSALKTVVITSGDSIREWAFSDCSNLTSITIPNSVTSIESSAFDGCDSLQYYEYGNGLYLGNVENNYLVLVKAKDTSITECTINQTTKIIFYNAFDGCPIETATIPTFACNYIKNSALKTVIITSGDSIGNIAFYGCSNLTSIAIPNSVTRIGEQAFYDCSSLTSITIPNSVTRIGEYAFYGCRSLTIYCEATSQPSGWKWSNSNCPVVWDCKNNDKDKDGYAYSVIDGIRYSLKDGVATVIKQPSNISGSITIPSSVTYKNETYSVTSIGFWAFGDCSSLTSIIFAENSNLTSIEQSAFSGCSGLSSITIPNSVTSIGYWAFSGCSSLTSISFAENSNLTSIGEGVFDDCPIETAIIPANVSRDLPRSKLTDVIINSGLVIPVDAFNGCSGLTSITIPDSVTGIAENAFRGCSSLTIYCEATSQPSGWNSQWNYSNCPVVWDCKNKQ